MKKTVYISLPKDISYSVFEALKMHVALFESIDRDVVYLSRKPDLKDSKIIYFSNTLKLVNYLRKQKKGIFYGITVFEIFIGFLSNLFGTKKAIIFWVQGLIDEEDFLSHKSKIRYLAFKVFLKRAISISDKLVVVTKTMFDVLVKSYNCKQNKEHIIINCTSRVNYNNSQKEDNSICYIGGLSKWQNVDKTLQFFNSLSKVSPDYTYHIATFNHEEIKKMIDYYVDDEFKNKIKLLKIRTASEVEAFLSRMQYGFLIRDNILLNNVASPIKLAEYLACGVNPILSDSLFEFAPLIQKNQAGIIIKNSTYNEVIEKLLEHKPSTKDAIDLYKNFFERESLERELIFFFDH